MTDFGGKTSIFSHPVYLFLRKFSLQDSRGGSDLCGGSVLMVKRRAEYVPLTGLFLLFAGVPMAESSAVKGMLMLFIN
ncbi:hypothetical protein BY43_00045 [Escherichia coli O25:NM str. E2539C1]|nr:hypothetical protein BY43_00045 [Escherichia coli O25:NM str. E2539C1]